MTKTEYERRRKALQRAFRALPYGAQSQAARDLALPGRWAVSDILLGHQTPNHERLQALEDWAAKQHPWQSAEATKVEGTP